MKEHNSAPTLSNLELETVAIYKLLSTRLGYLIFREIGQQGDQPISTKSLVKCLGVSHHKGTIYRYCAKLRDKGLIESETIGNSKVYILTEFARKVLEQFKKTQECVKERVIENILKTAGLSGNKMGELEKMLRSEL